MNAETRFWRRVDQGDGSGCWQWTGRLNLGYGRIFVDGKAMTAHRYAYSLLVGPIPAGLYIDHLCRNRACVRPDHLEAVTNAENVLRGDGHTARNARKTVCPKGHLLDRTNAKGARTCTPCHLPGGRARITTEEKDQIGALGRSGLAQRAIARSTGRSRETVQRVLKELGL